MPKEGMISVLVAKGYGSPARPEPSAIFDQYLTRMRRAKNLVRLEPRAARPLPAAAAGPVSRAKDAGPNCDRILGQRKAAPLLWTAADMFRRAD